MGKGFKPAKRRHSPERQDGCRLRGLLLRSTEQAFATSHHWESVLRVTLDLAAINLLAVTEDRNRAVAVPCGTTCASKLHCLWGDFYRTNPFDCRL